MKKESLILLLAIAPALALAQDYRREESPPIILKPVDPGAGARPHAVSYTHLTLPTILLV